MLFFTSFYKNTAQALICRQTTPGPQRPMGLRAHPSHQQKILEVRRFFVLLFLRFSLGFDNKTTAFVVIASKLVSK